MDERNPSDFVSYAQYLDLNQDDIQRAQEEAFRQESAAADGFAQQADNLSRDIGIEAQASNGLVAPQQNMRYGQYMEARRKALTSPGQTSEMSDWERAARAPGDEKAWAARAEQMGKMQKEFSRQEAWMGNQKAIGDRNAKNLNYTRDRMAGYAASKQAAGAANKAQRAINWNTYGTYGVQDAVDRGMDYSSPYTKNAWSVQRPGESYAEYSDRISGVYDRGREQNRKQQAQDKREMPGRVLGVGLLGVPLTPPSKK